MAKSYRGVFKDEDLTVIEQEDSPRVIGNHVLYFAESAIAFVVAALSAFNFPKAPSTELDPSWQIAYGYFFEKKLLAGVDYVFTFGPFGHFWSPHVAHYPPTFMLRFCWWLVFSSSLAAFLVLCASRFSKRAARIGFILIISLLISIVSDEVVYFYYVLAAVSLVFAPTLFLQKESKFRVFLCCVLTLFAFLSLTKFSSLLIVVLGLCFVCARFCLERRPTIACFTLGFYSTVLLGLWFLSGQNLTNIYDFIRNSVEVAAGYAPGMSVEVPDIRRWCIALSVCISAIILTAIRAWPPKNRSLALISGGFVVILLMLAMKASFVRGYGFWFFGFAIGVPFFILGGPILKTAAKGWAYVSVLLLYELLVVAGMFDIVEVHAQGDKYTIDKFVLRQLQSVADNAEKLLFLRNSVEELDKSWNLAVKNLDLPKVRKYVGDNSIDLFPNEPGLLILNGLNYSPRPVFESFAAYSERLQELNLEYYRSERAPSFVLLRVASIDGRFSSGDDSKTTQYLLQNYRPVLREAEYLLLKRGTSIAQPSLEKSLGSKTILFDQLTEVPLVENSSISTRIKLRKTLLGRLIEIFYAAPRIVFEVETNKKELLPGKLVPGIGESGILLRPLLASTEDWVDWFRGDEVRSAERIKVRIDSPLAKLLYGDSADIEFRSTPLSPPTLDSEEQKALDISYEQFFHPLPATVGPSSLRPSIVKRDGIRVVFVHAPSWIHFPIGAPGRYRLNAEFGILPGAESLKEVRHRTDGVDFSFRLGEQILAKRELRPVERMEDRLGVTLELEFQTTSPSTLVAEAGIGPGSHSHADWSYWKSIKIERIGD